MEKADFTILGGGWTGILSAYELVLNFPKSKIKILEKADRHSLGGLLHSESINGFNFDTGGPHILFSRNKEILSRIVQFLGKNVKRIERIASIYYNGKFIPYPFENGIYTLDAEERAEIGVDVIESILHKSLHPGWRPNSFRDWIYGYFGNKIGSGYLEPYNKKIWKTDPSNMDADWVFTPGRLPHPELRDIIYSVAGIKTTGYKEQQYFFYPKEGGIQALYNAVLEKVSDLGVELITNFKVTSIDKRNEEWLVNDSIGTKKVVSTLPLVTFSRIFKMPFEIQNFINELRYTKVVIVGVALKKRAPREQVLYIPSKNICFHRITWLSNLSGTPRENSSNLIAETTVLPEVNLSVDTIVRKTIEGLKLLRIIETEKDILFTKAWTNDFGYPIYMKNHNKIRSKIFEFLDHSGIFSVGRWGSWHYWNTDKVYEAVKILVNSLL